MQELLIEMQELRETAYRACREAELIANERGLAYADGLLTGIDMALSLVNNYIVGGNE